MYRYFITNQKLSILGVNSRTKVKSNLKNLKIIYKDSYKDLSLNYLPR